MSYEGTDQSNPIVRDLSKCIGVDSLIKTQTSMGRTGFGNGIRQRGHTLWLEHFKSEMSRISILSEDDDQGKTQVRDKNLENAPHDEYESE